MSALPPLDVNELIRMWNAGFRDPVRRLFLSTAQADKAEYRRPWLLNAVKLQPPPSIKAAGRTLRSRMLVLADALPGFIDTGTVDGCLTVCLLIDGGHVKDSRTIENVIRENAPHSISRDELRLVSCDNHKEDVDAVPECGGALR